ncbi:MAG: hypothetical protein FWH03_04540 [Firmicutes bacterium]|nr:hypothetical protein [Bacillota bacterium]
MAKGSGTWGKEWTSKDSEDSHFDDHGKKMGYETEEEYSKAAQKFANSKERGIVQFRAKNGSVFRFNPKTKEFIIITKDGRIVTYYYTTEKYFYEQFEDKGLYFFE